MKFKYLLLMSLSFGILMSSCEKDEDDDIIPEIPQTPVDTTSQDNNESISFSDADATLIAVNSESSTIAGTISTGTAIAVFYDNGTLIDAGEVKCETKKLKKNANNSYTFIPGILSPTGIIFSIPVSWEVAGGNGFPALNEDYNSAFPVVGNVTSGGTVSKANGYTLSVGSVSGADSILYQVGDVIVTTASSQTSYSFSSAELSGLANGTSVVSVAPYNYESRTISSKKVYFVNETVKQKTVNITD
jgi:hypothetical protein